MRSQQERWAREEMEDWFGSAEAAGGEVDYGDEDGIVRRKEEVLAELGAAKEKEERKKEEEKGDENEVCFPILFLGSESGGHSRVMLI